MSEAACKLQFGLRVDADWPPVSIESVWCEPVGASFRLKSAPFFIRGLAVGDVFKVVPSSPSGGPVSEFEILEPSAHSLVWILNSTQAEIRPVLRQLESIGCSALGLETPPLYAVDVPPEVEGAVLNDLLDRTEAAGFDVAFPVWRRA